MMTIPLSDRQIEVAAAEAEIVGTGWFKNGKLLGAVLVYLAIIALAVLAFIDPQSAAVIWGLALCVAVTLAIYFSLTWKAR